MHKFKITGKNIDPTTFAEGKKVKLIKNLWDNDINSNGFGRKYSNTISFDVASVCLFEDGTAVICTTSHSGPYSEVTPDIDYEVNYYSAILEAQ